MLGKKNLKSARFQERNEKPSHFILSSSLAEQGDFIEELSILDSLLMHRTDSTKCVGNPAFSNKLMLCIGAVSSSCTENIFHLNTIYFKVVFSSINVYF